MRILVTGGFGFIASELVRQLVARGDKVATIDPLTYAASEDNLEDVAVEHFLCGVEEDSARAVIDNFKPEVIFHAAAESHVDRSISSYRAFVDTNITGTFNLLEGCRLHAPHALFVYVSTDEVYGSLSEGRANEGSLVRPCNPYSVSKAAAENAIVAAGHTWGLRHIITRSCNNYGPRQHPEKLLPRTVTCLLSGQPVPVHGDGTNIREWIYVVDNCRALIIAADKGVPGEVYNITTGVARTNHQLVTEVATKMGTVPNIDYIPNRPGNDLRYAMTNSKLQLLGWKPEESLSSGLDKTISWYEKSRMWWSRKLTKPSSPAASR